MNFLKLLVLGPKGINYKCYTYVLNQQEPISDTINYSVHVFTVIT